MKDLGLYNDSVIRLQINPGGYSLKFRTDGLRPWAQTLILSYTSLYRNGTSFIYLEYKWPQK